VKPIIPAMPTGIDTDLEKLETRAIFFLREISPCASPLAKLRTAVPGQVPFPLARAT
jgi:hypothetical protein